MSEAQDIQSAERKKFEDFVKMAAHELKTPVTVLKAYLQLILLQLQKENQLNYIKTVEKMDLQLNKLLHLISDLQDGVQADLQELHCLMNDFDINSSITICCESAKTTNPRCSIEQELCEDCPELKGDHDRIEQVIHNFIANAIKYSGPNVKIKVKSEVAGSEVKVSVTDNGPGIPVDLQEHIFKQFYRVETTAGQTGGLGLGLFICREIIKKHNGNIGVQSDPGAGATFWFSLPLKNSGT